MKTPHKKAEPPIKKIIAVCIVAILAIGLCLFVLEKANIIDLVHSEKGSGQNNNSTKIDTNPPTKDQIDAGNQIKQDSSDQTSTDITVNISSIINDNDYLHIRTIINGVVSSNGSCQLTITDSQNKDISKSASTYAMPSYSTCQGFDISRSELSNGSLNVKLIVIINNSTVSAEKTFDLE